MATFRYNALNLNNKRSGNINFKTSKTQKACKNNIKSIFISFAFPLSAAVLKSCV